MRTPRSRNRRRQRGAAMVEAAIVAVFMMVMFACIWAAVRYQSAKLHAMDEARAAAWMVAIKACDGDSDTLEDIDQATDDSGSGSLPSTKQGDQFLDVKSSSLAKDSGYADITKKRTAAFPGLIGGQTHEMRSRMYIRCNEPSPPETLKDLFMTAVGVAKFTYGFGP